jgi:ArsR family transcriptional regulator
MDCKPCTYSSDAAAFLSVIAELNRLKILCHLKNGELCVCELIELLDIPQNLLSHHLKRLREFGLLESRKDGQKIYYKIAEEKLSHNLELINNIFPRKEYHENSSLR